MTLRREDGFEGDIDRRIGEELCTLVVAGDDCKGSGEELSVFWGNSAAVARNVAFVGVMGGIVNTYSVPMSAADCSDHSLSFDCLKRWCSR